MNLEARDLLLALMRFSHAAAAILIVGAAVFGPLFAVSERGEARLAPDEAGQKSFREIVEITLAVFVISGGILTFNRLSSGAASTAYVAVLGVKLGIVGLMYTWAFQISHSPAGWRSSRARWIASAGMLVVLLASVLKTLWESGTRL